MFKRNVSTALEKQQAKGLDVCARLNNYVLLQRTKFEIDISGSTESNYTAPEFSRNQPSLLFSSSLGIFANC
jgi:hypothetical protein